MPTGGKNFYSPSMLKNTYLADISFSMKKRKETKIKKKTPNNNRPNAF